SAVFVGQGIDSLRNPKPAAEAAAPAVDGLRALPDPIGSSIPSDPQTFAQINAAVQIGGGLLLATGKMPRVASAALAFTVLPANLGAHMFWTESDPQRKAEKRQAFLTDLSLLGGLMIASADTAGKPSLGWRGRRAAERLSERVSSALPGSHDTLESDLGELGEKIMHSLQIGAERGRELASTAAERGAPLAEKARQRGEKLADTARVRNEEFAESARQHSSQLADAARERVGGPVKTRRRKRRW
ncbi:DoxX family membrane protein, partial [Mycobacterium sp.]|uniref:DoxX family membrane protein n=1 Tax=Mycobacterium sp. TaxID=1785 RepID=UPI003C7873D5